MGESEIKQNADFVLEKTKVKLAREVNDRRHNTVAM